MRHNEQSSYDFSVVLMTDLTGDDEAQKIEETRKHWGWFYRYSLYYSDYTRITLVGKMS